MADNRRTAINSWLPAARSFRHPFHHDPGWRSDGIFAFSECRCGARRVRWLSTRIYGPLLPGWPPLVDRHGVGVRDTGWRRQVSGG